MSRKLLSYTALGLILGNTAFADVPKVAVDIAPVHSLVSRVMEGVGTPELVIPAGASPHGYSLRPSEAKSLQDADMVIWMGEDLAPWMENSIETLSNNAEVTRKAGPIIGASGAVLSVINEVLSRDDNQIKTLLQETIKLQSNVMVKYERLSFYKNSQKISDFQNKEIDLLIRTIENEREGLNKNLFTISENYKIIISEKRIKKMLEKKIK